MDVDSALVAARYFEFVRHRQEGSKVVLWAGAFYAVTGGSDYTCGCQVCVWGASLLYIVGIHVQYSPSVYSP